MKYNFISDKDLRERPTWDEYFIEIASVVAKRGTCLRRSFGAVLVKDNKIISTGYNGAPRGETNCTVLGVCKRQELNIPTGERYELCRSVHAEANAIIQACAPTMEGAIIYIAGWDFEAYDNGFSPARAEAHPCMMCARMIRNAKIKEIKWQTKDGIIKTKLVEELGT